MLRRHSITPCLWFAGQAEEAANYYVSIFPNSKITSTKRYCEVGSEHHRQEPGSVMFMGFELDGQPFIAMNGPPIFKFSEAVSFQIACETQAEVDHFWDMLTAGGDPNAQQCGWAKDKFGLSWQIVPNLLQKLLGDPDTKKAERALAAMMEMKKLDMAGLQKAFDG
ncbi:MAG TPA: VOC family protein [Pirellulales bacterium]